MNHNKKFEHTVNVLLKAYLNDTLQHCNCHACAVGNLIGEANGYGYTLDPLGNLRWSTYGIAYWYDPLESTGKVVHGCNMDEAKQQCASIGYTIEDVAKIEHAFESAEYGDDNDDHMFNGLMAVIDVLAEIHGIDLETVKETKELFA